MVNRSMKEILHQQKEYNLEQRNKFWKAIEENPNDPWDWGSISSNVNFTPLNEILEKYSDKPLNWSSITYHDELTVEILKKYIHQDWDWDHILLNHSFDAEELIPIFIDNDTNPNIWGYLSSNPSFTLDLIEKYSLDKRFSRNDWKSISSSFPNIQQLIESKYCQFLYWRNVAKNRSLTLDLIEKHFDKFGKWTNIVRYSPITMELLDRHNEEFTDEDWLYISSNTHFTVEMYEKYFHRIPSWKKYNVPISPQLIQKYPDNDWNWYNLSDNKNSLELFEAFPDKFSSYDLSNILRHPNLTLEIILKFEDELEEFHLESIAYNYHFKEINKVFERFNDMEWNWYALMRHPHFSVEKYLDYLEEDDWVNFAYYPLITIEIIEKNMDKLPDDFWKALPNSSNFTYEMIEHFSSKDCFDWSIISRNLYSKRYPIKEKIKEREKYLEKKYYYKWIDIASKPPNGKLFLYDYQISLSIF